MIIKLIGSLCIVTACSAFGIQRAKSRKSRYTGILAMISTLRDMRLEIAGALLPLPEIISRLSKSAPKDIREFYIYLNEALPRIGTESFGDIWKESLENSKKLQLEGDEYEQLCALGNMLGRYPAAEQADMIDSCCRFLEIRAREKEEEAKSKCVVDMWLGLASGILIAIMLV